LPIFTKSRARASTKLILNKSKIKPPDAQLHRASINGSIGINYSLILACDFQSIMLFFFYLHNVTSRIRGFADPDFQILKLNGSPYNTVMLTNISVKCMTLKFKYFLGYV
jgi:hypothetical protein